MEKQEFCMEKSQIFQEMISRISKLSQDSYLMVTDMQHNLTFVPESTAEFLGIPSGWCEDGYKIVLEKSVHPYDCPEYTEEMKKRLRGINLENDLYIRMGKDKKYVMTQIITDMILEQGKNRYFIVLLRNQNVIPEIDPLTDLYGQVKFEKDIVDYIQQGRKVAVLEIEIDHMNDINILYGTNYSDRIQKVLAYRFIYMMDADKAVYRMGNSNYAFILRDASREEAAAFLEKIRARLEESVVLENNHFDLKIYASGIILDHYEGEISTVQSKLEYVLGKMRTRRDHKLMFFNDLVQINGDVDLDLMKVIHQSVLNQCDGFYVEYQPVVHAQTGEIVGAEALVRWKKEPYGIVPPGMFIDWLESNPCMYDLGNFVLKQALTDAVEFRKSNPDFFINVNVSAKQLEQKSFRDVVLSLLKENDYPPNHLCLEITERCRQLPIDVINEEVCFLQQYGIHFAMDDYGTGNASSSIVLGVPMNEIKIDMSFIKGILNNEKQQMLVKNIVNFARSTNMKSCIEGVEDKSLQDYLRSFGATWFQGYYYSRPLPEDEFIEFLEKESLRN